MGKSFSWGVTLGSIVLFIALEMLMGGVVGPFVGGRYLSYTLSYALRGFLNLASYALGGLIIGALVPYRRIIEPTVAAFLYVFFVHSLSFFHPHVFYQFLSYKVVFGGAIAAFLAYIGAQSGVNLMKRGSF
jgi:hypothetical protein